MGLDEPSGTAVAYKLHSYKQHYRKYEAVKGTIIIKEEEEGGSKKKERKPATFLGGFSVEMVKWVVSTVTYLCLTMGSVEYESFAPLFSLFALPNTGKVQFRKAGETG